MEQLELPNPSKDRQLQLLFLPSGRKTLDPETFGSDSKGVISSLGIKDKKGYYSPEERAAFLYEAITAKDEKGNYLYHNICLGGGNGAEDTIQALEKLLKDKNLELPKRAKDLNIFGFSDASQLHHYLGQRGVATQIYYSAMHPDTLYSDVSDTLKKQGKIHSGLNSLLGKKESSFSMDLSVINNPTGEKEITGFTQPGSITSVEHRPTHQLQTFSEGSNMLIIELTNQTQIDRLKETLDQMENKNISLILSKDMTPDMTRAVAERFPYLTILSGALVGHKDCLTKKNEKGEPIPASGEGKPIPLFAESTITINKNGTATLKMAPTSSEKAQELSDPEKHPKRIPTIQEDPQKATTELTIKGTDAAGRAVLSDLTAIKQNQPQYTIKIENSSPEFAWQKMELGIKELLEHGIINPNTLQQLNFSGKDFNAESLPPITAKYMQELAVQYLPKLGVLTYNDTRIPVKGLDDFWEKRARGIEQPTSEKRMPVRKTEKGNKSEESVQLAAQIKQAKEKVQE